MADSHGNNEDTADAYWKKKKSYWENTLSALEED